MFSTGIITALTAFTLAALPAQTAAFTYEANPLDDGGWTLTQDGIPTDRECVINLPHNRAIVVADTDPLCQAELAQPTALAGLHSAPGWVLTEHGWEPESWN